MGFDMLTLSPLLQSLIQAIIKIITPEPITTLPDQIIPYCIIHLTGNNACGSLYQFKPFFDYFIHKHFETMSEDYPLIPQEAFLFFPTQAEVKPSYRKIFGGNIHLEPHEISKLKQFDQYILKQKAQVPEEIDVSMKLRFLQSCGYSSDKAFKAMVNYLKWKPGLPQQLTPKMAEMLGNGVCYISGRDYQYRPIIVIDVKKMIKLGYSHDDLLLTQGYFFNFIIENIFVEGQIENWVSIIDLGNTGLFSVSGPFKKSISLLSDMFRCRMHLTSVLNCPGSISMLWGMAKGFVEEDTQKKISFEGGNIAGKVLLIANSSQVEVKYGGTQPNITSFWPPKIQSFNFKINNINNLITVEEYRERYEQGLLQRRKVNRKFLQKPEPELLIEEKPIQIVSEVLEQKSIQNNLNYFGQGNQITEPNSQPKSTDRGQKNKYLVSQVQEVYTSPHVLQKTSSKSSLLPDNFPIHNVKSKDLDSSGEYLTFAEDDDPPPVYQPKVPSIATKVSTPTGSHNNMFIMPSNTNSTNPRPRINYIPIQQTRQKPPKCIATKAEEGIVAYINTPKVAFISSPTAPPKFPQKTQNLKGYPLTKPSSFQRYNSQSRRY